MKKRLLCLGLLAVVSQLFATGCLFHPVARWRANHPCGVKTHSHPLLHPFQTRRAAMSEAGVGAAPTVGPVVGNSPCHGCGATSGVPVGLNGGLPGDLVPVTNPPTIGSPYPLGGPTVVPSYELPRPMAVPGK